MTLGEAMAMLTNVGEQLKRRAKTDKVVEKLAMLREAVVGNWVLQLCLTYAIWAVKKGDRREAKRLIDICWGYFAAMDDARRKMFNPLP